MVSLEWAAGLGRAIPENWFRELLAMSEEKAIVFQRGFLMAQWYYPKKSSP